MNNTGIIKNPKNSSFLNSSFLFSGMCAVFFHLALLYKSADDFAKKFSSEVSGVTSISQIDSLGSLYLQSCVEGNVVYYSMCSKNIQLIMKVQKGDFNSR